MLNQIYKAASTIKDQVNSQVEFRKLLKESTSNEAWNLSNTKLQVLAEHSFIWEDYQVILKHLWDKLNSNKPKEWRRVAKAIHVMDFLVKNGAPRIIQDLKDDLYKIRKFQDFTYKENGVVQGIELKEKATQLCGLLSDPAKIQYEREFAKQTREKFMGVSSAGSTLTAGQLGSAAPASGTKYGGFGSEDIAKLGFNNQEQFGAGPYDPYTKTQSSTSYATASAQKSEIKKKIDSDSDKDSSDSDSDSDSDDSQKQKKKQKKLQKQQKQELKKQEEAKEKENIQVQAPQGLSMAPKASRAFVAPVATPQKPVTQTAPSENLFDLFGGQQAPQTTNQNGFGFMNQDQSQQNGFGFMNQESAQQNSFAFMNQSANNTNMNQQNPFGGPGLFDNMNVQTKPAAAVPFSNGGGDLFSGLSMPSQPQVQQQFQQQPQQSFQQQQQSSAKKPSLWNDDKSSKLFDISSSSLNQATSQNKSSEPNLLSIVQPVDLFAMNNQSQFNQQSNSGFKPSIDANSLLNQSQMQQMQQQRMMMMMQQQNQYQYGQMAAQGYNGQMPGQMTGMGNNPNMGMNMGYNPNMGMNMGMNPNMGMNSNMGMNPNMGMGGMNNQNMGNQQQWNGFGFK